MKLVLIGLLFLLASAVHWELLEVLSEYLCSVEITEDPIRIESCQLLESGGMSVSINTGFPVNDTYGPYKQKSWTIVTETDGYPVSCEETSQINPVILDSHRFEHSNDMLWLIARTEQGDTLWTCALEGTDEYDYSPDVTRLPDNGYLLAIYPDCWTSHTKTARISSTGEMLWNNELTANYLLGLPEPLGEMKPQISSFRETTGGDILVCGSVSEWATTADISYICLLDGDTGDPLWKNTNSGMGEAEANDIVETSSGLIIAVGTTAESIESEDVPYTIWGLKFPFITVLDSTGILQQLLICQPDQANMFYSIIETDPIGNEFLIAGGDSLTDELVLLRVLIPTDLEEW